MSSSASLQLVRAIESYLAQAATAEPLPEVMRWLENLVGQIYSGAAQPVVWVAKNGADDNPGTYLEPKLTIQAAVNAAPGGGAILIAPGIYFENVVVPPEKSLALRAIGQVYLVSNIPSTPALQWIPTSGEVLALDYINVFQIGSIPAIQVQGTFGLNCVFLANGCSAGSFSPVAAEISNLDYFKVTSCNGGTWEFRNDVTGFIDDFQGNLYVRHTVMVPGKKPVFLKNSVLETLVFQGSAEIDADSSVTVDTVDADPLSQSKLIFRGTCRIFDLQYDVPLVDIDLGQSKIDVLQGNVGSPVNTRILARGAVIREAYVNNISASEVILDTTEGGGIYNVSASLFGNVRWDRDSGGDIVVLFPGLNYFDFGGLLAGAYFPNGTVISYVVTPESFGGPDLLSLGWNGEYGCYIHSGYTYPIQAHLVYRRYS